MNERVEELKMEFEEYVKNYNPYENNIDRIFRDWMFEKLAAILPNRCPPNRG
jgi:hypothetical protein